MSEQLNGAQTMAQMRQAGFNDQEVNDWADQTGAQMRQAGFSSDEINDYFGRKQPDLSYIRKTFENNIAAQVDAARGEDGKPKPLSLRDAVEAGWGMSTTGLIKAGHMPDKYISEADPWYNRVAASAAQMVGDVPAMVAGFMLTAPEGATAGAATGATVGAVAGAPTGPGEALTVPAGAGIGAAVGGTATGLAGAFALPAAIRATLIDSYTKGDFKNWQDFHERASGILLDTAKAYATGYLTGGVGAYTGAGLKAAGVGTGLSRTGQMAAEVATMTTVGKALDGQVPSAQDFLDGAILMLGAKAAHAGSGKLMELYKQTGVTPQQALEDAQHTPSIAQDLATNGVDIPKAYEPLVDPMFKREAEPAPAEPTKAAEPASKPEPGSLEDAQQKILDKINTDGEPEKPGLSFDKFYGNMVDHLDPIRRLETDLQAGAEGDGRPALGDAAQSAYKRMRLMAGVDGIAKHFLEFGALDYNTREAVGPSFKEIVAPFKEDLDGFRAYLGSRRALELNSRGLGSGMDITAAKAVVEAGDKTYGEAAQKLFDWQDNLTKYLRDSGVLSADAYKAMRDVNKSYVPFYRIMDDGNAGGPGGGGVSNPLKGIKGSERDIVDPLESMVRNAYSYVRIAEQNAARRAMLETIDSHADVPEEYYQKVAAPVRPIEVGTDELAKFLKGQGIDTLPDEAMTVFRAMRTPLAKDEFGYYEDGKYSVVKMDPDLAEAFNATPRAAQGLLMNILKYPASLFRAGLVTPEFIIRHLVRNQMATSTLAEHSTIPFWDTFKGVVSAINKDDAYQNFIKSGGLVGLDSVTGRDSVQAELARLADIHPETSVTGKVWNLINKPLDWLHVVQATLETGTRIGAFNRALGDAEPTKQNLMDAGFAARDVAPDPSRIGRSTATMNAVTALFNIEIQHTDQLIAALRDRPVATLAKVFAGITLPSIALWYANRDQEWYQNLPNWEKDTFWVFKAGDTIGRVPKPFLLGVAFGTGVEKLLDGIYNPDESAGKALGDYFKALGEVGIPHVVPNAVQPALEQLTNYSFFRGDKLVPDSKMQLLPELRYSDYTTETTKLLGRTLGQVPYIQDTSTASPIVIDNYVRQWTGGVGVYALTLADLALRKAHVLPDPVKAAATLADIPVVKAFVVRYPDSSAQPISDFYKDYSRWSQVRKSVDHLDKNGDFEAAQRILQMDPVRMANLDGFSKALGQQAQLVHLLNANPDITPEEKRQLIDATYYNMIKIAKAGNETMKQLEHDFAESKTQE